jgi:hypothetical protein
MISNLSFRKASTTGGSRFIVDGIRTYQIYIDVDIRSSFSSNANMGRKWRNWHCHHIESFVSDDGSNYGSDSGGNGRHGGTHQNGSYASSGQYNIYGSTDHHSQNHPNNKY